MNQQTTNRDTGEAAATNAPANSATSTSTPDNQPTPLDAFEVLLITGMSGAGRSHAADCVEDMGWYVVDNLPPKLLIPLVDMMTTSGSGSESGVHKLAAVIDVRSSYFDELAAVLDEFTKANWLVTAYPTQGKGDAIRAARELGPRFSRLVCAGGDGTLSETVTGLMQLEKPPILG